MGDPNQAGGLSFLAGGGEMGARIRAFDWSSTPLGRPNDWPQSLKTSIRIMLMSRQPVWIGWGKDLIYFYNDPYFSIIGGKHPWALGRPTQKVWHEIWDVIAPMLDTAMSGDEGTYVEEQLLIMERNGYPEETYYTFSYSPIPDDEGSPGGIFCANTDDTERVMGQRELALLRDLAGRTAKCPTVEETCRQSIASLETNRRDFPFAALYLVDEGTTVARLFSTSGVEKSTSLLPTSASLNDPRFGFGEALRMQTPTSVEFRTGADIPLGEWTIPSTRGMIIPMGAPTESSRPVLLYLGLSPYRLLDEPYKGFIDLVVGQIAAALADAEAAEMEHKRLESLAELDRAKSAFFANISHEFRTPLALMLGPLQDILQSDRSPLPSRIQEDLHTVQRNGQRLQKLVNALLDFSRIEAGRMQAEFRPVDLGSFAGEIASSFQSAVEKAGLRLMFDFASTPAVYIDQNLWEKVVMNLLSNAFKHTFEGSITVKSRTLGNYVELSVADTGIGIAETDIPHLFERFRRVPGARARTHEGSGIGLALVQEIVKLHGAEITVESSTAAEVHGTTFRIKVPIGSEHLPQGQVHEEKLIVRTSDSEAFVGEVLRWLPGEKMLGIDGEEDLDRAPTQHGERILVAEDNADMRAYLTRLLSPHFEVRTVGDGQAAVEAIKHMKPDLVLSDVMMPALDGFGVLHVIRSDPATAEIPVILLSARAGEEAKIEGLEAGADDYLVKPFSAREVVARVESALALAKLRKEAALSRQAIEQRLSLALTAARMAAWEWDPVTDDLTATETIASIFGAIDRSGFTAGKLRLTYIYKEDAEAYEQQVQVALRSKSNYVSLFRAAEPCGDGRARWLEEHGYYSPSSDGSPRMIGVLMDVTERQQIEEQRSHAEAILAAEKRVLELIATGADLSDVLNSLLLETEALSKDNMKCSVLLLDETETQLMHGGAPSLPGDYNEAINGIVIGPGVGSCGTAAFTKEAVFVEDVSTHPYWEKYKDLAIEHGLRACCSTPILSSKGRLLGTVAMYYPRQQLPCPADEDVISRTARLAAIVIERDRAVAEAEAQRARIVDLFTRAPAVICLLKGPDHVFDLVNPFYLELVGRKDASELLAKPIRVALPEIVGQGFVTLLDQVYETGQPYIGDEMLVKLNRAGTGQLEDLYMNFVYMPTRNAVGEIEGVMVHAVDVTAQVLDRRRVEELADELELRVHQRTADLLHANEQLRGFSYSVAHDLRQQIRGINVHASLILHEIGDTLEAEPRENLDALVQASRQLARLVDDLLQYAKLATLTPSVTRVNLSELSHEVVDQLRAINPGYGNTTCLIREGLVAEGDAGMLRLVLENLFDNAFKYSASKSDPYVEFGREGNEFFVADNGVGFDMSYAHKLFQPFERLHREDSVPGTGIGLANAKRIIERHEGSIRAEGAVGQGAKVYFTLPKR
jgi:signal transduction histidine kinase/DNA-binding response OmpR family regulator